MQKKPIINLKDDVLTTHLGRESGPDRIGSQYHKICTVQEADRLMNQGWKAADLHVHTWNSYDVLPLKAMDPLTMYRKAREKGLTFITFTDHDTMEAYDRVGWTREGVVPGVEIKILDPKRVGHTIHVNVYELDKKQFLELERIADKDRNIETFINYLKDSQLDYIYNHPFWFEHNETSNLKSVFEVASLFPVIEYNMGRVAELNHKAMMLADMNGRGLVATTDTHSGDIGGAITLARGETFKEYFNEIKAGRSRILPRSMTVKRMADEVNLRLMHLFNKEQWHFEKPEFRIETGIRALDNLIKMLVASNSENQRLLKIILFKILQVINNSSIPTFLYIQSQKELVSRINQVVRQYAPVMDPVLDTALTT
jgi:predicted metal-dependent phosphoesterase TrpH